MGSTSSFLKLYSATFVFSLVVDFIWIGLIAKGFYQSQLVGIGRFSGNEFQPVLWSAVAVYVLLTFGLLFFVLPLLNSEQSWFVTFLIGAGFGLVTYGIYDFTNYAILEKWTLAFCAVDIAWGTTLNGIMALFLRWIRPILT